MLASAREQRNTVVDMLCRDAVSRLRSYGDLANEPGTQETRMTYLGEVHGICIALCHLHGWNPDHEADKGGAAWDLVLDWWQAHYPQD